jgi:hypothetical protein
MAPKDIKAQFQSYVANTKTDLSVGGRFGVGGMGGMNTGGNYMNQAVTPSVGRRVMVGQRGEPSIRQQVAMAQMGGAQTPSVSTGDPVSPYGGNCLAGMAGCEIDPAEFCGWSILPFSSLKVQGSTPNVDQGAVVPGTTRIVRITSERACQFRVRGLWWRGFLANGSAAPGDDSQLAAGPGNAQIRPLALSNVTINNVPRVVEIGSAEPPSRVFTPSDLFDGTFWVLPVDWGTLSPINNTARPLELQFNNFGVDAAHCFGVLFGDVIGNASGTPAGLTY